MTHYVICPYSKPEHAGNLLSSIGRQRHRDFVPVIVENGPGTGTIEAPPGGVLLRSDAHQSAAKNAGLAWVRSQGGGQWSVFDCDDYYAPGYLEDQISALASADVAGKSFGSVMYVRFDDGLYLDGVRGRFLEFGTFFNGGATSCATSDVPDYPMTKVGEDGEWHKLMVALGVRSLNTGARHYCYDRTGTGHTWNTDERLTDMLRKRMLHIGDVPLSSVSELPRKIVSSPGMSIARVVMLSTPDYAPAEVAVPDMRAYCRIWGYELDHYDAPIREDWPASWNKLLAVVDAMSKVGEGEWILWMDCDMLMTRLEAPLETVLRDDKDYMVSVDGNGICTGFFAVRNVPIMRAFMQDLMKDFRPDWPWDQDATKDLLAARPDYAARAGHIPESLVQNPMSHPSKHAMVMHYWGNSKDKTKLLDRMRQDIRYRETGGSRYRRPWMRRS